MASTTLSRETAMEMDGRQLLRYPSWVGKRQAHSCVRSTILLAPMPAVGHTYATNGQLRRELIALLIDAAVANW